jgi:hypothetical protein
MKEQVRILGTTGRQKSPNSTSRAEADALGSKVRFWTVLPIVPTTVEGLPLYHEYKTTFSDGNRCGGIARTMELLFCEVFQLVFQPKYKTHINHNNQSYKRSIQITPAHQLSTTKPAKCGLCCIWASGTPCTQDRSLQSIRLDTPAMLYPPKKKDGLMSSFSIPALINNQ